MPLLACAEFDDAINHGGVCHHCVFVFALLIIQARAAALYQATGFAAAGGEAGAVE
jgi:hypothetical protein